QALGWARGDDVPYRKQSYVTVRGFEVTGSSARVGFAGDHTTFEYLNVHDITTDGAAFTILYTYSDSCVRLMDSSAYMTVQWVSIDKTFGEAIYVGSIDPDCPVDAQCMMANTNKSLGVSN